MLVLQTFAPVPAGGRELNTPCDSSPFYIPSKSTLSSEALRDACYFCKFNNRPWMMSEL